MEDHAKRKGRNNTGKLHRLCAGSDALAVKEAALKNRNIICERDSRGMTPIHVACRNSMDEGPEIVDAILSIDPLAAKHVDILGQLPLHIACCNEGPSDQMQHPGQHERSAPCVVRLVKSLLRIYPQAAAEHDMDGLLPIHWALRNGNKGSHEAVQLLLQAYPDSALSEPFSPGGLGLEYTWGQVLDCLTFSDGLLGRRDTLTSLVLPISRIWNDGHKDTSHTKHQQTPQFAQAVQDVRNMCPSYQLKKMFFDVLRDRVAQLYSQRQKRSTQRKNLQQFTDQYCNSLVGNSVPSSEDDSVMTKSDVRINEWVRVGKTNPRILSLVKELPAVHTPRLFMMLSQRRNDWIKALAAITPKDILYLQEHLPAHLAAGHCIDSGVHNLRNILAYDPLCLAARDSVGLTPLHVACANGYGSFAEDSVAMILEHAPETAFTQDHRGMLPIHHACLNSGPAAGSITGRLISVFAPGTQVVDDYGRLPLECALSSSSEGVGEIIKSVVRAFPPAARVLDRHGNNVLHRASLAMENNPQAPAIIEALLELKIRPNTGALFNYNRQLPLHIAATSANSMASRCLEMLADAYIPGAWAQDSDGETALHLAIRARNLESVRTLTIKSRDKAQHMQNRDNKFPLNLATTRTYREVICNKGGANNKGDIFTRRLVGAMAYVWFLAAVVSVITALQDDDMYVVQIYGGFLGLWLTISILSNSAIGHAVEEAGWIGRIIMSVVPTLKSLESFLMILPLSVVTAYRALWVNCEGECSVLLSNQIELSSAVIVVSANAIMEDGSRFHALDLMPSASYAEIVVLFLYRISECVARIAVLAIALIDVMHCHDNKNPADPCGHRGCLIGNPNCYDACTCVYKESVFVVIIVEFLFLLVFLRVTASQDQAQSGNALENLQNHIKIWACSLCNMLGIYLTPPKTMITYLGLKQTDTAFIGEVKLLDGVALLLVRAISNSAFLIIFTEVGNRLPLWDIYGSSVLLLSGIVCTPLQQLLAYLRYIIWDKIEKRVEMRFKLMSKREQIASSRGFEASTDHMKILNNALESLGKILQPFNEKAERHRHMVEANLSDGRMHTYHERGEPTFHALMRQLPRQPGERHVLPTTVPDFVRLETNMEADLNGDVAGVGDSKHARQDFSEEELREIFNKLDDNGDGEISMTEFIKGLRADSTIARRLGLPTKIRQEDASRDLFMYAFGEIDVDMSKSINFEEFIKFYMQHPPNRNDSSARDAGDMQQGKRNQATSAIPERLDLQVMEERVRWINRAGLTEVESGQIGNIGKNLHMEQTEWSKQLDEVVQGAHVYMDQLMPQEINFENHDSFLSLESMAIPSSSFAQFVRRSWSAAEVECKIIFSWGSSDRRAWQIRESLKTRGPGRKTKSHAAADAAADPDLSKSEKSGPPSSFKVEKIRILIAELLQVHPAQVNVYLMASPDIHSSQVSATEKLTSSQRSESKRQSLQADLSTPGQSDAILTLGPSQNSLDRRTPEQLFHILETAVMDAILGPLLPPPLSQLVSLTVTRLPSSPFRQDPSAVVLSVQGAQKWMPDLPWQRQAQNELNVVAVPHPVVPPMMIMEHGEDTTAHQEAQEEPADVARGPSEEVFTEAHHDLASERTAHETPAEAKQSLYSPFYHTDASVANKDVQPSGGPAYSSGDSHGDEEIVSRARSRLAQRHPIFQSEEGPGMAAPSADDQRSDRTYMSDVSDRTHSEERMHRRQLQLQQQRRMQHENPHHHPKQHSRPDSPLPSEPSSETKSERMRTSQRHKLPTLRDASDLAQSAEPPFVDVGVGRRRKPSNSANTSASPHHYLQTPRDMVRVDGEERPSSRPGKAPSQSQSPHLHYNDVASLPPLLRGAAGAGTGRTGEAVQSSLVFAPPNTSHAHGISVGQKRGTPSPTSAKALAETAVKHQSKDLDSLRALVRADFKKYQASLASSSNGGPRSSPAMGIARAGRHSQQPPPLDSGTGGDLKWESDDGHARDSQRRSRALSTFGKEETAADFERRPSRESLSRRGGPSAII